MKLLNVNVNFICVGEMDTLQYIMWEQRPLKNKKENYSKMK